MRTPSNPDPGRFQKVLADAFVVQESEIETRSLSAVVELQGMIATGKLDIDQAMTLIADRARDVANAAGIAIALLRGDQLTYRAGSGSSVDRVGRNMTAVLSVSSQIQSKEEILRVEDAQADRRIEAAICRQFGARSLLILPIYDHRALVGVLEVIFGNAHEFHDREVRTYRLMASLVGDAMSHAADLRQKKATAAAERPGIDPRVPQASPELQRSPIDEENKSEPISNPSTRLGCRKHSSGPRFLTRRHLAREGSVIKQRAKNLPSYKRWTVAVVIALVSWIAYRGHRSVSAVDDSGLPQPNHIAQPSPSASQQPSGSVESRQRAATVSSEEVRMTPTRTPRWIRVNSNELDYMAEDVTVRHFTRTSAQPPLQVGHSHVKTIGDDVTVRYFGSAPLASRVQPGSTDIHYISEDAVPPVRPKRATPGASEPPLHR